MNRGFASQTPTDANLVLADVTTNNASTTKHGFLKKLSNSAAEFMNGVGNWVSTVVQTNQANTYSTGAQSFAAATSLIVPVSAGYAPTADGSFGYDSTQDSWSAGGAGAVNGHVPRVLYVATPAADTLTAATINTTETEFATTFQIPANFLVAGKVLRITYLMQHTATATIPTSLARIRLGAVGIGGTVVFATTATSLSTGSFGWGLQFCIIGTAAPGASVNVVTQQIVNVALANVARSTIAQPVAAATNGALNINLTWNYSSNAATNTTTLLAMIVEELN